MLSRNHVRNPHVCVIFLRYTFMMRSKYSRFSQGPVLVSDKIYTPFACVLTVVFGATRGLKSRRWVAPMMSGRRPHMQYPYQKIIHMVKCALWEYEMRGLLVLYMCIKNDWFSISRINIKTSRMGIYFRICYLKLM